MSVEVHHLGLTVSDLERSVEWYCTNLGFRDIGRAHLSGATISEQTDLADTDVDIALLAGENIVLELLRYANPLGDAYTLRTCDVGAAHPCVVVRDMEATCAAMRDRGVAFHARPANLVGQTLMVYVRDPDGIMIELIQPGEDLQLCTLLDASRTASSIEANQPPDLPPPIGPAKAS